MSFLHVARQALDEGGGAGSRDGAEILDQLVMAHADAVVGDGEGVGLFLSGVRVTAELGSSAIRLRLGERQIAQPVAGVGRVGDQLAQEDFLLAVERVGDDVQQAADLRLEGPGFLLAILPYRLRPESRAAAIGGGAWRFRRAGDMLTTAAPPFSECRRSSFGRVRSLRNTACTPVGVNGACRTAQLFRWPRKTGASAPIGSGDPGSAPRYQRLARGA